jgi:hypothetical protein
VNTAVETETKTVLTAVTVLAAALGIASYTQTLSGEAAAFLGAIGVIGVGAYWATSTAYVSRLAAELQPDTRTEALGGSKPLDKLWKDLNEWEDEDPRDTELTWQPLTNEVTTIPLPPTDPSFFLTSIVAKDNDSDERLHVVVETQTGYIVHHMPVDEDYAYDKNKPFEQVPFVRVIIMAAMMDTMEKRKVKNQLQQMAQGQLPGGYGQGSFNKETEQVAEELRETEGQPPAPGEDDLDDAEAG